MSTSAGPSGLSSSGLPEGTQLHRGHAAKLTAHAHVAGGRGCFTLGIRPARGGGHMYLRGLTSCSTTAIGPRFSSTPVRPSGLPPTAGPTLPSQTQPPHRTAVMTEASRRSSSKSRAAKHDSNNSSGGKGFGNINTNSSSSSRKNSSSDGGSKRHGDKHTSSKESTPDSSSSTAQGRHRTQPKRSEPTRTSISTPEAAAAAQSPKPSDLQATAGHIEVPPGPSAVSSAQQAADTAATAAAATATSSSSTPAASGVVPKPRPGQYPAPREDVDSMPPGPSLPDSPPNGPDSGQPDHPSGPSGSSGRDRSDEQALADPGSSPHSQLDSQDSWSQAAATAAADDAAADRASSSGSAEPTPTAAAVSEAETDLRRGATPALAATSATDELLQHVKSQAGTFKAMTGMGSKEYIQALNEPHFPSLEVSEEVRKSDPDSHGSSQGGSSVEEDSSSNRNEDASDRFSRWQQRQRQSPDVKSTALDDINASIGLMSATAGRAAAGAAANPAPAAGGLTAEEIRLGPEAVDRHRYQALEQAAGETAEAANEQGSSSTSSTSSRRRKKGSKDTSSNSRAEDASVARYMAFADDEQVDEQQQLQGTGSLSDAPATAGDLAESEQLMSASAGAPASGPEGPAPAAGGLTLQEVRLGPEGVDSQRYQALEEAAGEVGQVTGDHSSSSNNAAGPAALSPNAQSPGALILQDSSSSTLSPSEAVQATMSGTDPASGGSTAQQLGSLGGDIGGSAAAAAAGDDDDTAPAQNKAAVGPQAAKGQINMEGAAAESAITAAVEGGHPMRDQADQQQQRRGTDTTDAPATAYDMDESERLMSATAGRAAAGAATNPAPAAGGLTAHEIRLGPDAVGEERYTELEGAAGEGAAPVAAQPTSHSSDAPDTFAHAAGIPGATAADVAAARTGQVTDISGEGYAREGLSADAGGTAGSSGQLSDAPATASDLAESEQLTSASAGAAASGPEGPAPAAGGLTVQEVRLGPERVDPDRYSALGEAAGETANADSSRGERIAGSPVPSAGGLTTAEMKLGPERIDQDRYRAMEQAAGEVAAGATTADSTPDVTPSPLNHPDLEGNSAADVAQDMALQGLGAAALSDGDESPGAAVESAQYQPDYQAFGGQVPEECSPAATGGGAVVDEDGQYEPDYQASGGQVPEQFKDNFPAAGSEMGSSQAQARKSTANTASHNFAADASAKAKESLHKAVQKVREGSSTPSDTANDTAAGTGVSSAAAQPGLNRPASPSAAGPYGSFAAQRLATAAADLSKNGYTAARRPAEAASPTPTDDSDNHNATIHTAYTSREAAPAPSATEPVAAAVQKLATTSAAAAQRFGQDGADVAQQLASASSAAAQQLSQGSAAAAGRMAEGLKAGSGLVVSAAVAGGQQGVRVVKDAGQGVSRGVQVLGRVGEGWLAEALRALQKLLRGLSTVLRVSGMFVLTRATQTVAALLHILRTSTDRLILQPSSAAAHILGSTVRHTAKHTQAQLPAVTSAAATAAASAATAASEAAAAASDALGTTAAAAGSSVTAAAGAAARAVGNAAAGFGAGNAKPHCSSSAVTTPGRLLYMSSDGNRGKPMQVGSNPRSLVAAASNSSMRQQQAQSTSSAPDEPVDVSTAVAARFPVPAGAVVSAPGPNSRLQTLAAGAAYSLGLAQAQAVGAATAGIKALGEASQQAVSSVLQSPSSSSTGQDREAVAAPLLPQQQQQQQQGLLAKARGAVVRDVEKMTRPPASRHTDGRGSSIDRYAAISILGSSWEEPDPVAYSSRKEAAVAASIPASQNATHPRQQAGQPSEPDTAVYNQRSSSTGVATAAYGAANGRSSSSTPVQQQAAEVTAALALAPEEGGVLGLLGHLHELLHLRMQLKEKIRHDTQALNKLVQQLAETESAAEDGGIDSSSSSNSTGSDSAAAADPRIQEQLILEINQLEAELSTSLQQLDELQAAAAHIQAEIATATDAESADVDAAAAEADADSNNPAGPPPVYGADIGYSRNNSGGSSSSSSQVGSTGSSRLAGGGSSGGRSGQHRAAGVSTSPVPGAGHAERLQLPAALGSLSRREQQQLLRLYASSGGVGGPGGGGGGSGRGGGRGGGHWGLGGRHSADGDGGHGHQWSIGHWLRSLVHNLSHMHVSDVIQLLLQAWLGCVVLSGVAWYAYQLLYKMPVQEVKQMATTAVHAAETGADVAHGAVHTAAAVAHAVGEAAGVETSLPSPDELMTSKHSSGESEGGLAHKIKGVGKKLRPAGKSLGQGLKGLGVAGQSAVAAVVSPVKAAVSRSRADNSSTRPDTQAVRAAVTRLAAGLLLLVAAGAWSADDSGKGGKKGRGFSGSSNRSMQGHAGRRQQTGAGSAPAVAAGGLLRSVVGAALAVPAAVLGRGHNDSSGRKANSSCRGRAESVVMGFDDGTIYGNALVVPGDKALAAGTPKAAVGPQGCRALMSGRSALLGKASVAAADSHEYVQLYRTLMDRQGSWR